MLSGLPHPHTSSASEPCRRGRSHGVRNRHSVFRVRPMNLDADVGPLAAPDALDHGSTVGFGLPEVPHLAPGRREAQRNHSVGAAMWASQHGVPWSQGAHIAVGPQGGGSFEFGRAARFVTRSSLDPRSQPRTMVTPSETQPLPDGDALRTASPQGRGGAAVPPHVEDRSSCAATSAAVSRCPHSMHFASGRSGISRRISPCTPS